MPLSWPCWKLEGAREVKRGWDGCVIGQRSLRIFSLLALVPTKSTSNATLQFQQAPRRKFHRQAMSLSFSFLHVKTPRLFGCSLPQRIKWLNPRHLFRIAIRETPPA